MRKFLQWLKAWLMLIAAIVAMIFVGAGIGEFAEWLVEGGHGEVLAGLVFLLATGGFAWIWVNCPNYEGDEDYDGP